MKGKSCVVIIFVSVFAFGLIGCNGTQKPDKWKTLYMQSQVIIKDLSNENNLLRGERDRAKRDCEILKLENKKHKNRIAVLDNLFRKRNQKDIDEAERIYQKLILVSQNPVLVTVPGKTTTTGRRRTLPDDKGPGKTTIIKEDEEVEIIRVDGKINIRLKGNVFFASGKSSLTTRGKASLRKIAPIILEMENAYYRVDGHTDSQPIRSSKKWFRSNRHLSAMRALSVLEFLTKEAGIPKNKIFIAGFGEHWPRSSNSTAKGREQNRRVEIWVLPKSKANIRQY